MPITFVPVFHSLESWKLSNPHLPGSFRKCPFCKGNDDQCVPCHGKGLGMSLHTYFEFLKKRDEELLKKFTHSNFQLGHKIES